MSVLWNIMDSLRAREGYCRTQINKIKQPKNEVESRLLEIYRRLEKKRDENVSS